MSAPSGVRAPSARSRGAHVGGSRTRPPRRYFIYLRAKTQDVRTDAARARETRSSTPTQSKERQFKHTTYTPLPPSHSDGPAPPRSPARSALSPLASRPSLLGPGSRQRSSPTCMHPARHRRRPGCLATPTLSQSLERLASPRLDPRTVLRHGSAPTYVVVPIYLLPSRRALTSQSMPSYSPG
jgi:hypothetical protein